MVFHFFPSEYSSKTRLKTRFYSINRLVYIEVPTFFVNLNKNVSTFITAATADYYHCRSHIRSTMFIYTYIHTHNIRSTSAPE